MFTENDRRPWGALILVLALLGFGGIILVSLFFAGTLCPYAGINCGAASGAATEAAPAGSLEISFYSSNTKEAWINVVTESFNAAQIKTASGKPIFVRVTHVTSGGSQQDILNGKIQPTVWSPGDQSWVDGLNQVWQDRNGKSLVTDSCPSTIYAPIGFVMWRPMAEALGWPDKPIGWDQIVALAADPDGWATYGHPEWGQFKFGHTNPDYSNSGMLMLTALAYSTLDLTSGLTADKVKSQAVIDAMRQLELHTYHYGTQSRDLLALMARRGPSYLHAGTSTEAETLKYNLDAKDELRFPLVFIFPAEGTYWTGQLYCILNAEWVSDEQREAAGLYRDYLLDPKQQAIAIDNGLRPLDLNVPLHAPFTLENGTDPSASPKTVPDLSAPSGEAANAVKDVFHQTKKKATVVIVLDTSGSMEGDKMTNATKATADFLKRLEKDDEVYVIAFSDSPTELQPAGRAGDVAETLSDTVLGLYAEGGTALYDSVCAAADRVNQLRADHEAAGDKRLYGIVVLSDGQDTASDKTENDMFNCLPNGEDVEGVKVFTIAYGSDADTDVLLRAANRTNGKTFTGDPETIDKVYTAISAEQ